MLPALPCVAVLDSVIPFADNGAHTVANFPRFDISVHESRTPSCRSGML